MVAYARQFGRRDGDPPPLFQTVVPPRDCGWGPNLPLASLTSKRRAYPSVPRHLRVDHGLSGELDAAPWDDAERELAERRVFGCGNAVVPQVAEHMGRCLLDFHAQLTAP